MGDNNWQLRPSSGPRSLNSPGTQAPFFPGISSDPSAQNQWENWFGKTGAGVAPPRPIDARDYTTQDLPAAFYGKSHFLSTQVEWAQIAMGDFWWRLAPVALTNIPNFHWDELIFNPATAGLVPHEAQARMTSYTERRHQVSLARRGTAFQFEKDFMLSEMGRTRFLGSLKNMSMSVTNSIILEMMRNIRFANMLDPVNTANGSLSGKRINELMVQGVSQWHGMLSDRYIVNVITQASRNIERQRGEKPDTILVSPRFLPFIQQQNGYTTSPEYTGNAIGQQIERDPYGVGTFMGLTVHTVDTFALPVENGSEPLNLMAIRSTVGEFYRHTKDCDATFRSCDWNLRIYDEDNNRLYDVTMEDFINNCQLWNSKGRVRDLMDDPGLDVDGRNEVYRREDLANMSLYYAADGMWDVGRPETIRFKHNDPHAADAEAAQHDFNESTSRMFRGILPVRYIGQISETHFPHAAVVTCMKALRSKLGAKVGNDIEMSLTALENVVKSWGNHGYDDSVRDFWELALRAVPSDAGIRGDGPSGRPHLLAADDADITLKNSETFYELPISRKAVPLQQQGQQGEQAQQGQQGEQAQQGQQGQQGEQAQQGQQGQQDGLPEVEQNDLRRTGAFGENNIPGQDEVSVPVVPYGYLSYDAFLAIETASSTDGWGDRARSDFKIIRDNLPNFRRFADFLGSTLGDDNPLLNPMYSPLAIQHPTAYSTLWAALYNANHFTVFRNKDNAQSRTPAQHVRQVWNNIVSNLDEGDGPMLATRTLLAGDGDTAPWSYDILANGGTGTIRAATAESDARIVGRMARISTRLSVLLALKYITTGYGAEGQTGSVPPDAGIVEARTGPDARMAARLRDASVAITAKINLLFGPSGPWNTQWLPTLKAEITARQFDRAAETCAKMVGTIFTHEKMFPEFEDVHAMIAEETRRIIKAYLVDVVGDVRDGKKSSTVDEGYHPDLEYVSRTMFLVSPRMLTSMIAAGNLRAGVYLPADPELGEIPIDTKNLRDVYVPGSGGKNDGVTEHSIVGNYWSAVEKAAHEFEKEHGHTHNNHHGVLNYLTTNAPALRFLSWTPNFVRRWMKIRRTNSVFERGIMMAYLSTPVSKESFLSMYYGDVMLPVRGLLLRPHMCYDTEGAVVLKAGATTMHTFRQPGIFMVGASPTSHLITGQYTAYVGNVIHNKRNIWNFEHLLPAGYLGGTGVKPFVHKSEDPTNGYNFGTRRFANRDMFYCLGSFETTRKMPSPISLTGRFQMYDRRIDDNLIPENNQLHWDMAPFYQMRWGWNMDSMEGYTDDPHRGFEADNDVPNSICFQGDQLESKNGDFTIRTTGNGHFGGKTFVGCHDIRAGRLNSYGGYKPMASA